MKENMETDKWVSKNRKIELNRRSPFLLVPIIVEIKAVKETMKR